jgi:DNA-binding transcriptional ArsR family regulator
MVERGTVLDATFSALSDPTRRALVSRLARSGATVGTLAAEYPVSFAAVSKHLQVLERAGLVSKHRQGREVHCRLVATPMREAASWLDRYRTFWSGQLDALAAYVEERPS